MERRVHARAYVSSTVSVIDTTSKQVSKTVELGISSEPTTIAFA